MTTQQTFLEMFELSMREEKGLTFFLPSGQTISAIVTKVVGTEAVEGRNQTYDRIVIRLDQLIALAF